MLQSMPIERGCGYRKKGGVYAECPLGPGGSPLEDFILCPPVKVNLKQLRMTQIGVYVRQDDNGQYHVFDWIGYSNYPYPADYLEEIRRFGLSTRLELSAKDYSKLEEGSYILPVHGSGWIDNWEDIQLPRLGMQSPQIMQAATFAGSAGYDWHFCPKHKHKHEQDIPLDRGMCAGLWWEVITGTPHPENSRAVVREMPAFKYVGGTPVVPFQTFPAMIAKFPIRRIVVINDPEGKTHQDKLEKLGGCHIPVVVEDF